MLIDKHTFSIASPCVWHLIETSSKRSLSLPISANPSQLAAAKWMAVSAPIPELAPQQWIKINVITYKQLTYSLQKKMWVTTWLLLGATLYSFVLTGTRWGTITIDRTVSRNSSSSAHVLMNTHGSGHKEVIAWWHQKSLTDKHD